MKINATWYNSYNLLILFHESLSELRLINPTLPQDIKHLENFIKWYSQEAQSLKKNNLKKTVNSNLIQNYKEKLQQNNISQRNINRRMAFVFKFLTFCAQKGFVDLKDLNTSESRSDSQNSLAKISDKTILVEFNKYLKKTKMSSNTIKNYINDVTDYMNFISSNKYK